MFMSRFTQEQRDELVQLRERVTQLTAKLASTTSTSDWLMARVNSLEKEREALTERLFKVAYDVPVIERNNERAAGVVQGVHGRPLEDGMIVPPHLKDAMKFPAMADPSRPFKRPPQPTAEEEVGTSISAHQAALAAFDDMGDEAAAEHGIVHTDDGAAVYTR